MSVSHMQTHPKKRKNTGMLTERQMERRNMDSPAKDKKKYSQQELAQNPKSKSQLKKKQLN